MKFTLYHPMDKLQIIKDLDLRVPVRTSLPVRGDQDGCVAGHL